MTNENPVQLSEDFVRTKVIYADNSCEKEALEQALERLGTADTVRVELREPRYTYGC